MPKIASMIASLFLVSAAFGTGGNETTITYSETDAIFLNPERGFSTYRDLPFSANVARYLRQQGVSVIQRILSIPQFRDTTLASAFLETLVSDFNAAREGGVKLIVRFSYTEQQNGEDAPLHRILTHLDQLEPVLAANYDVIAYLEAGFIGAWGEWYYSTNNLNNTIDRRAVLFKILSVLPERPVAVRTPEYKRKIFNYSEPLIPDSAFTGSYRARTGAHNDCFLASSDDYGTYLWNDIEGDKSYLNLDNRYVPQGGETCNPGPYSDCTHALADLARMHWSVLNRDYHPTVLDSLVSQGCMDEIKRRLGYRFRLLEATIQDSARPGGVFNLSFYLVNDGWASPFNPRLVEVILRERISAQSYALRLEEDPRVWLSGDTVLVIAEGGIPANMPLGGYDAFLHLPDPMPALYARPEFSIRLANDGIWEDSTGFNALQHEVTIDPSAAGSDYSGEFYFMLIDSMLVQTSSTPTPSLPDGSFELHGNYPNPFNGSTTISIDLNRGGELVVEIFNLVGRSVGRIQTGILPPGWHEVSWRPDKISSGIYLYRVSAHGVSQFGKAVYIK